MDALFASVRCGGSGPRAGGMNPTHTNHDDSFVDASSVVEHAVRLSQAFEHATRGAYTTADGRSSPSSIGSMLSGSTASLSASASAAGSMTSLPTRCSTTSPITPRGGSAAAGVGHLTSPMRRLDIARPARGSDASRNASAAALTPTDQERHRFYWAHSGGGNSGAGATAADRDVLAAAAASPLPQYSQASGAAQRPGSGQCTFADFTLHGGSNSNSSDDLNSSLDSRNGGGSLGFSASPSRHSHTSPAARRRFPVEGTDASLRSPADVAAHPRPPVLGVLPHTSHAQSEATPRHLLAAAAAQQQGRHPLHDQDLRQPLYHLRRHHPSSSPSTEQNGPFAPPLSAEHPPLSRPFPMWIERETSESQHGRGTDQRSRSTHEHQHDPHLRQEQPDDDSTRWLSPLRQPQTASCTPSHGQSQSQSQVQAQSQSRPHSAHRCTGYGSPQSPYATATVSPRGGAGLLSAPASISSPSRRRAQRHSVSGHMPSLHELEEARPETPPKRHRVTGHEQHPPDFAHLLHHQQASAASPCLPHLSDIDSASDFDLAAMDDVFLSPGMMSTSSHVDSASVCGGSATDSTPSGNACYASAVVAAATVSTPSSTSPGGDSRHGQHGEHMERGGGGLDPFGLSLGLLATSSSASAASTGTAAQQQHAHELFMELSDDDLATLQQELNMSPAAGSNHSSPTRRQPPSVSRHSDAGLGVPASFGWGQEVYAPVQNKEQLPPILAPLSSASNTQPMVSTGAERSERERESVCLSLSVRASERNCMTARVKKARARDVADITRYTKRDMDKEA